MSAPSTGLAHQLPLACPSRDELASGKAVLLDRQSLHLHKETLFSARWLEHLRSRTKDHLQEDPTQSQKSTLQVAVHLRRGDVDPCKYPRRYLPNKYYTWTSWTKYLPPLRSDRPCKVTAYSEAKSLEPFDVYRRRGFGIDLDSSLEHMWRTIMTSDVVILSRSSFSQVPAKLNENLVISPCARTDEIPGWTSICEDSLKAAAENVHALTAFCA